MLLQLYPGIWVAIPIIFFAKTVTLYGLVLAYMKKFEESDSDAIEIQDDEKQPLAITDDEDFHEKEGLERIITGSSDINVKKENNSLLVCFPLVVMALIIVTALFLVPTSCCSEVQLSDCEVMCNSSLVHKVFVSSYSALQCCSCGGSKGVTYILDVTPPPEGKSGPLYSKEAILSMLEYCSDSDFSLSSQAELQKMVTEAEEAAVNIWSNGFGVEDSTSNTSMKMVYSLEPANEDIRTESFSEVSSSTYDFKDTTKEYSVPIIINVVNIPLNGCVVPSLAPPDKFQISAFVLFLALLPVFLVLLSGIVIMIANK